MIESLVEIIIVALIVTYAVQGVKKAVRINKGFAYLNKTINLKVVLSIVLSVIICAFGKINIFTVLGITITAPVIPETVTALIVAQGATVVHDIQKQITELKERK